MKDNNNNIADDAKAEEIADCTASNNNECPMTDELVEQVAQHEDTKIEEQCSSESNIEDNDKSFYIDFINKSNFYLLERKELLEIVLQYNELFETINSLNNKLDLIKTEVLKANLLYDDFKRNFATIVDTCPWFEKLYYALPIFEDYDDDDVWISQWCKTVQAAVTEDNRNNLRNFINKNLFNSIYTLPKEVYCYKVNSKETKGVNEETAKFVFLLASRIARYIKYIKDTSDRSLPRYYQEIVRGVRYHV